MEHCEEIKSECNQEEGETIHKNREHIINDKDINYILRIEINQKYINLIITIKDNIENKYKIKMELF